MKKILLSSLLALSLFSCSKNQPASTPDNPGNLPAMSLTNDKFYIRARAVLDLKVGGGNTASFMDLFQNLAHASGGPSVDSTDITVTNGMNVQFQLEQSQLNFSGQANNNVLTSFLQINPSKLFDNNMVACGGYKCLVALIRMYTVNPADNTTANWGPGLWDSNQQSSVALHVSSPSSPDQIVGYGSPYPTVLEQLPIGASTESIQLSDFTSPNHNYQFSADFSLAPAGTFSTRVVVEYVLAGPDGVQQPGPSIGSHINSGSVNAMGTLNGHTVGVKGGSGSGMSSVKQGSSNSSINVVPN